MLNVESARRVELGLSLHELQIIVVHAISSHKKARAWRAVSLLRLSSKRYARIVIHHAALRLLTTVERRALLTHALRLLRRLLRLLPLLLLPAITGQGDLAHLERDRESRRTVPLLELPRGQLTTDPYLAAFRQQRHQSALGTLAPKAAIQPERLLVVAKAHIHGQRPACHRCTVLRLANLCVPPNAPQGAVNAAHACSPFRSLPYTGQIELPPPPITSFALSASTRAVAPSLSMPMAKASSL